ncbi:uncharacterized protein LOC124917383 [Impatiens glandulifera]|uniref:uncharacterized protein LOC124917383 n=1 Tax=Impatiens glandulifera TaxID=253017 RepID=UPI001FB07134|nr:uncharacterized protein LOC124917383 [Impatiens glandulifera]
MTMPGDEATSSVLQPTVGLVISKTYAIHAFLISAAVDPTLPQDIRQTASTSSLHVSVPYRSLRSIWLSSNPSTRPGLTLLLSGSGFLLNSPKPREKSEELKARLKKLTEVAERKEYEELVKDIAPKKSTNEPFSSYKDQLGFGLHVVVVMFTGYLVGYAAFRALFSHNPVMNTAGGILGLVGGMLVETLLFIIRTNENITCSASSASKLKKDQ